MKKSPFYRGKVRDLYEVDDERMIIVSTDRISAFDVVFSEAIPKKGIYLNEISSLWFWYLQNKPSRLFPQKTLTTALNFKTHFITNDLSEFPEPFCHIDEWNQRAMLVYKTKRIDFECVVRGYLLGSAWKEYQATQKVSGIALKPGLKFGDALPEFLFTPTTKEELGKHDINVDFEYMQEKIGSTLAQRLKEISLSLFKEAKEIYDSIGFILCDTKFEFGIRNGEIYLIDEVLTPDSSRFWKKGNEKKKDSYDKQILRDYLEKISWDKNSPPPPIPQDIISELQSRYEEIYLRLKEVLV
ncbi:MAG: phosphoribosylaminoimidazolesuccinocarboxamide synthase [Leptospiraceae bacterium]|nr:phosphoribosylaminoimidazolesuccinocarboxamide synthase [Leptospiraceae bacterium]MDW7975647.1 phosphoribosylaminoimidazolesuccinocarboxamide synthase [Leptospiraceae bacterium]